MAKPSLRNSVRRVNSTAAVGGTEAGEVSPPSATFRLKNTMNPDSWMLTQSFVHWAEMWENCREGAATPYNEDSRMVMLAPFTFFNANPGCIGVMFNRIVPYFLAQYGQYMTDKLFAEANPMPWLILQSFAPQFAMQDKGHDASLEAWRCIREMRDNGDPALETVEPEQNNTQPGAAQRRPSQPNRPGGDGRTGQTQHPS